MEGKINHPMVKDGNTNNQNENIGITTRQKISINKKHPVQTAKKHIVQNHNQPVSMGQVLSELLRMIEQIEKECEGK